MANYLIEIGDSGGNTLYVALSVPAKSLLMPTGNAGYWRALDKGLIKPTDGALWWEEAKGTATGKHINLLSKGFWGIKLFDFKDFFGVNSDGSGVVIQPWVIQFVPGRITWSIYS